MKSCKTTKCKQKARIASDWSKQCIRKCNVFVSVMIEIFVYKSVYCMKPMVCDAVLYNL